jgi:HEPN domain-containing protein
MNATVKEWVAKAEADFASAGREIRARKRPNYDSACFHSQQCLEKLMKALLIDLGTVPPKTHDLVHLNELLGPLCIGWSWPVEDLRLVSRGAVAFRYPGESATKADAREAYAKAGRMRERLLRLLGVPQPKRPRNRRG